MNLDRPLEQQFPGGAMVWHKVTGTKGMVVGHSSYIDGTTYVIVSTGFGSDDSVLPDLLTMNNPEFKSVTE